MTDNFGLSLIIEWENATRIGTERAERMFGALAAQLRDPVVASFGRAELLVLYPAARGEPAVLRSALARFHAAGTRGRAIPVDTDDYYQQKNVGARLAEGRLLVFIDSDVIPREGWLRHLLEPTVDPAVALVGGETTIECDSPYARMIALIWIFKLPRPELGTRPSEFFWANNFVVRREVFAFHSFPDTGQYRGQCGILASTMLRAGFHLRMSHQALVEHSPPPFSLLLQRGYRSGKDLFAWLKRDRRPRIVWTGTKVVGHDLLIGLQRIRTERRAVGLTFAQAMCAGALALAYNGARALGFVVARLLP